jgi:3-methyladenine DNA glycosylase Tag
MPKKPTPPERIPRVVAAPTLDDHLAIVTRAIFQAGLSWALIAARWDAFRAAFDDFSIERVAAYGAADVARIMEADGVIHSLKKIEGTIANARTLQQLAAEFGSPEAYARSFASYDALYADAKQRFASLGDLSCYYWLFRTGLPVPPFERWMERQERDHPRMREMVLMGRSEGVSAETA